MKEYIKYGIGITIGCAIGNAIVETVKYIFTNKTDKTDKDEASE